MVRGIRLLGPDNKLFGEWRGFGCLPELISRFGEANVTMMMRTIQYLLLESLWGVRDTPTRLHELEEWLLASLPIGRYEQLFVITTLTSNTDAYPSGMRDKAHCRPTAYGMYDMEDILQFFDGIRDKYNNAPTVDMMRSLTCLSCKNENASGLDVRGPSAFVVMEGCRYPTERDHASEYVTPVINDFKNYFYQLGLGYDQLRLHSAFPIGIMVFLQKRRFYDMSIIGLEAHRFNFKHMQLVFPQPVIQASDQPETAKGHLQQGQKLPALSVGLSTLPGGPSYWKINGPEHGPQGHYYTLGSWDGVDKKSYMILPNPKFTNRYPLNARDLRGLVSVSEKDR